MSESTARAERYEPQGTVTPFYIWDVPQNPVSIRVSLDVIDRLEREVVASFRSVSNRGSEIGGLLLGRVIAEPRPVVSVEAYELISCDYTRGPLYRLSDKDSENLDDVIRQRNGSGRALVVVGMFRSNTRKELACDHEDLALMKQKFQAPENVLLLVKPYATRPAAAGFFTWEDGMIQQATRLEFPFSRTALVAANSVRAIPAEDPAPAAAAAAPLPESPEAAAAPPPAAPAAAKPAARAQVVPIASRREPPAPPPLPSVAGPEAAEPQKPEPGKAVPEPAQTAPVSARPMFGAREDAAPERARGSGKLIWILGGATVVALLLVTLLVYPGLLIPRGQAPATPAVDTSTLALRVERTAGQLLLTWNREAEAVKTATRAVLTITDGPQQDPVELDLAQLRNGSVVYSPLTGDVSFRLEVTAAKPELSKNEYVRVLGSKPSPMAPIAPESAKTEPAKPGPAPAAAEEAEAEAEQPAPAAPAAPRESLSAKLKQTESLGQRLRPARPSDLPEPPSLDRPAARAPASAGLPLGMPQAPARPAAVPPPPPAPRVGGNVQEAQLVSRTEPAYPPLARQARVQGIVQLEALVGKDGRVKDVKVVNGHPLLRQAAADAVKKWLYRPTLLNGEAVEVTTRVAVGFKLGN